MKNQDIAKILREIGMYLEIKGIPFKPQAYEKAALSIESLSEGVEDIYKKGGLRALEDIPGVGISIAEKIEEFIKTDRVKEYEKLKKELPVDLSSLTSIEGVGPKLVLKLYKKLKVKNIDDLEKAAKAHKIRVLEGFGEKSETNILKGIEFVKKGGGRFLLGSVLPTVREIENKLGSLKEVRKIVVAGSIRRRKETIGDADILIVSQNPKPVMDFFVSLPDVIRVYAHGETKSAVKLKNGFDVDVRVVEEKSFGAALAYFTGSKEHNIAMREIAIKKGLKLSEYGLFRGAKQIAGKTEEEIYRVLGLQYIEPEMRENRGELELAKKGKLPKLIGYDELQGDLQTQTNWTDGKDSIEAMARAAMKKGLKYIAITDHTKRLAMTGGLDEKKILKQMSEIDRVNKKLKSSGFRVLKSSECDILPDGSLDLPNNVLSKLDVVGASVHSRFNLSKKEQTERIKKAMENPHVDVIFHPTGRLINRRSAYEVDIDELIKTAQKTKTILEIDGEPNRLDLNDENIRKAKTAGIKFAIDSDAHSTLQFDFLEFGIAQARRGWCTKQDVINTRSVEKMLRMLK